MMPPSSNGRMAWPSGDDNTSFNLIVILVGIVVGSILVWVNFHTEVSAAVMRLRHWEIGLLRHVTGRFDLADRQMMQSAASGVTLGHLYGISHAIGLYCRWPAVIVIVGLAVLCVVSNAPGRFRRQFDLDGLAGEQAITFPASAAFAKRRNLELVAPAEGEPRPADYALTGPEWIARYARLPDGKLDVPAARRALKLQLGSPWRDVRNAEPVARCMFVVMALHLAERRDEALDLLGELSAGLADGGADEKYGPAKPLPVPASVLSSVDAVLAHRSADVIELVANAAEVAGRHAWTHTALMGLLTAARQRAGVLAPGQFAWLKLIDRRMWYALHSLGFETEGFGHYLHPNPRVEALGARDHWALERAIGGPVAEPILDQAIEALRRIASPAPQKRG